MIEACVAYATFFSFYACHDVYPSDLLFQFSSDFDAELLAHAQCFYFYALVVMQVGNALTSRTARVPAFRHSAFIGPARNLRFLAAFAVSAIVFCLTCYLPVVQHSILNTRGLTLDWQPLLIPWVGAATLICSNEARKIVVERYPGGYMAKLAWE